MEPAAAPGEPQRRWGWADEGWRQRWGEGARPLQTGRVGGTRRRYERTGNDGTWWGERGAPPARPRVTCQRSVESGRERTVGSARRGRGDGGSPKMRRGGGDRAGGRTPSRDRCSRRPRSPRRPGRGRCGGSAAGGPGRRHPLPAAPPPLCVRSDQSESCFFFLCLSSGRRGQRRSCALLNQVCRPPRAPAAGGARRPGRAGAVGCPPPPRLPPPAPAQPLRLHPSRHAPRPDTWQGSTTARAVLGGDQAVGVCRSGEGAAAGHPSNPSIPPAARRGSRLVARRATGR